MSRLNVACKKVADAARRYLPEHVLVLHRPNGVTTIKLGTQTQLMAIGGAALVTAWLGIATANMVSGPSGDAAVKTAELARMQSQLAVMKSDTSALKGVVADRAAQIEKRQQFLAAMLLPKHDLAQLAAMLPRAGDVMTARDLLPDAPAALLEPFRKLETEQLAFVDKATTAADARLRDTQSLVRRLGLDPDRLMAQSNITAPMTGMGGPYIPVRTPIDAEPKFKDLFLSWKKLQALESAMSVVPSYVPVKTFTYTSTFGVRYDPFNGNSAMHAGVDMAGPMGEPIYAAANGVVVTAGRTGGYGNMVEINHGKGMATRYGHLSAILVHPGQKVHQGEEIARMGSTGRSTGTHLHFEVRVDGQAVNPRPYLDASQYVLAAQSRAPAPADGGDVGPVLASVDTSGNGFEQN